MKDFRIYICFGIILLAIIIGINVSKITDFVMAILAKSSNTLGGRVNVIITYIVLVTIPIAPFVLQLLKPVPIIALTISLLPLFQRMQPVFGIYAYTDFNGNQISISGISIFAPLLLGYLLIRYPTKGGWRLPSCNAYWVLAASGVITQFFFFPSSSALRIGYLVVVVQLILYLTVIKYVNTIKDAYTIIWGIIIAGIIYTLLTIFTTGEEGELMLQFEGYGRLRSTGGLATHYGLLMASLLSLLPILYYRSQNLGKIIILSFVPIFFRGLLLTGARAAYLSLLPILGYLFIFRSKKKHIIPFIFTFIIVFAVYGDQISLYLTERPFDLGDSSFQTRYYMISYTLSKLISWPHFLIGFGLGTLENCISIIGSPQHAIQGVHEGFLSVWVTTGLAGLLGFLFWLGYSVWAGIRKAHSYYEFEGKLLLFGLVISVSCWVFFFLIGEGSYTTAHPELYAIFTTKIGLLVALGQKNTR